MHLIHMSTSVSLLGVVVIIGQADKFGSMLTIFSQLYNEANPRDGESMFPKIIPYVSLFPKSHFPCYFPMFPKIYVLKLMFPCSLKVTRHFFLVPPNHGKPYKFI